MNALRDPLIETIDAKLRPRMPTAAELLSLAENGIVGPEVTVPAVEMHLLLSHIRLLTEQGRILQAEKRILELHAVGALPRRHPPMGDGDQGDYAGELAKHALFAADGDPLAGASALVHGAVTLMVATLHPDAVIETLNNVVELFGLHAVLGVDVTKQ